MSYRDMYLASCLPALRKLEVKSDKVWERYIKAIENGDEARCDALSAEYGKLTEMIVGMERKERMSNEAVS